MKNKFVIVFVGSWMICGLLLFTSYFVARKFGMGSALFCLSLILVTWAVVFATPIFAFKLTAKNLVSIGLIVLLTAVQVIICFKFTIPFLVGT